MSTGLQGVDAKGSWEWLRFAAGLPAKAIPINSVSASGQLVSGRYIVTGISLNNSATTGGLVTLHDGGDASGVVILEAGFSASSTAQVAVPSRGVLTEIGIYLSLAGGLVSGCVYAIPLWAYNLTPPGQ